MASGFNLKYGDEYENESRWEQFVQVMNCARGRKNMFIYRLIAAHVVDLGLDDADGYQILSAIESWSNDRLSSKGFVSNRNRIPEKAPPFMQAAVDESFQTGFSSPDKEPCIVSDHIDQPVKETVSNNSGNTICGFDLSSFAGSK